MSRKGGIRESWVDIDSLNTACQDLQAEHMNMRVNLLY
jgi:hypothetical protein